MPIYKNGNKYIVKVSINGRQVLRRKYLGKTIDSKEMAIQCEKDLLLRFEEHHKDYSINELFNLFEEYLFKRYKETTAKRYLYSFNLVLKKYFTDRKISDITFSYCDYINECVNSLPHVSIDNYIYLLKTFVSFLSMYGLRINLNCFYTYKKSRNIRKFPKYYTFDEFNKFYSAIEDISDKLMFKLLYFYGLRCGELRALKVSDFKKDRLVIDKELSNKGRFGGQKIFDTKTSSSIRFYPYVDDIYELFSKLILDRDLSKNDFVFKSYTNSSFCIGETTIRRKVQEYSAKAGIKPIKVHEFRHSCATYLINKNVDPKDIASWLGHSSVNVTLKVYAHLLPIRKDSVKEAFNKK